MVQEAPFALIEDRPALLTPGRIAGIIESGNSQARQAVMRLLYRVPSASAPGDLIPVVEVCGTSKGACGRARIVAHLLCGGDHECAAMLRWLGLPAGRAALLRETATDADASRAALTRFIGWWDATADYPETRDELAGVARRLVDLREDSGLLQRWSGAEDLELLKQLHGKFTSGSVRFATGDIDQAITRIESADKRRAWWKTSGGVLATHALIWILLIGLYPRVPMVQALFFWNPWMRRIGGLGYVGLLLAWVPWLRRLLFLPFRESLLADAALAGFEEDRYFPNSLARPERSPETAARAVVEAIPRIQGQIVLTGDSGLGKTMFLRHLVSSARRVSVYLPAWKCEGGVLEAIQQKLHGPAPELSAHPDLCRRRRSLHRWGQRGRPGDPRAHPRLRREPVQGQHHHRGAADRLDPAVDGRPLGAGAVARRADRGVPALALAEWAGRDAPRRVPRPLRRLRRAADTRDHSVSDDFVRRLRLRQAVPAGIDSAAIGTPGMTAA